MSTALKREFLSSEERASLQEQLRGADILITGGTGSFGKTLLKTLLTDYDCRRVIVFSRDELKQSVLQTQFPLSKYPSVRFFLGDVRDAQRLKEAFRGVKYVVHAAALKQVPALEYNPLEAVKTNVLGAENIIRAAIEMGVKKLVALSTDKAAFPVNLYGATKLCSDKLFVSASNIAGNQDISFSVVRYGNVFGSRGSVVEVFHRMKECMKLTITDERMTRFSLVLPEAVDFVLSCFVKMQGSEIFVPKIPSYRINTLARAIAPAAAIDVVGRRPGEKLHECMIPQDEAYRTFDFGDRYIIPADNERCIEICRAAGGKPVGNNFFYSSDRNTEWLTEQQLRLLYIDWAWDNLGVRLTESQILGHGATPSETPRSLSPAPSANNLLNEAQKALAVNGGQPTRQVLLPYAKQWVDENDVSDVMNALRSSWLTTGPTVAEFEKEVCQIVNAQYGVAVNSGTAALHCAAFAAGVGPGDEVIVPSLTFAATSNVVLYLGGIVKFADVQPDTLLIDPESVKALITPKTKAIIAVDYAGQPCDYNVLSAIAKQHNIVLIADAAHSIGAFFQERPVGSLADISCFSFHPAKNITTGEGGMVVTNNEEYAKRARRFRGHGISSELRERHQTGKHYYEMVDLGFNYRITDFQCALGISQLRKLHLFVSRRQEIAEIYSKQFKEVPEVTPIRVSDDTLCAFHIYVILLDLKALSADRDTVFNALRAENVGVNVHYMPVHLHPYYQKVVGTRPGMTPIAEDAYSRMITLPLFAAMSDQDVDDVVRAVKKVVGAFRK